MVALFARRFWLTHHSNETSSTPALRVETTIGSIPSKHLNFRRFKPQTFASSLQARFPF